jgi:four helix bundle protein
MTEHFFDHDRLDVYRLSIEYVATAFDSSRSLEGLHRHARDQWLRAAQSIPLNIAEGNGKRSLKDRARFLDIARGSALECAAIQDVLVVTGGLSQETDRDLRSRLVRIVAMLTRMAMKFDSVSESSREYNHSSDYEHEHRDAEHEHEEEPEQSHAFGRPFLICVESFALAA